MVWDAVHGPNSSSVYVAVCGDVSGSVRGADNDPDWFSPWCDQLSEKMKDSE